jgi:peptidoglycan/LPS O-acetylase OafA/YrhL
VPMLGLLRKVFPWLVERPSLSFPLALLSTFAVASLCYRYVEAPILAHKERFRPLKARAVASPAGIGPAALRKPHDPLVREA